MASGELPTKFKFFLYGKDGEGNVFLVQAVIVKAALPTPMTIEIKVKGDSDGLDATAKADQFLELMRSALVAYM
eukprot:CAMPEP_0194353488 /NCGR_PEP_ID=MMETSP0174-20130528/1804_1 /TAXON_ID=216777 /ORGANISM="Proboscia alata, Strain PI-D3" /LENGTH=73 /DNA_ID=CAMNT_0039122051 /DNA_START=22 /DNA_END=243 /DNA_ORIENTATION=+